MMYEEKTVSDTVECVEALQCARSESSINGEIHRASAGRSAINLVDYSSVGKLSTKCSRQITTCRTSMTTMEGESKATEFERSSLKTVQSRSNDNPAAGDDAARSNKTILKPPGEAFGRIRVIIRFRPLDTPVTGNPAPWCVQESSGVVQYITPRRQNFTQTYSSSTSLRTYQNTMSLDSTKKCFRFDAVMGEWVKQEEVMVRVGGATLDRVMEGYNGTILCYGQSGSGKTHTMFGPGGGYPSALRRPEDAGLVSRMLTELLERLQVKFDPTKAPIESESSCYHNGDDDDDDDDDDDVVQEQVEWGWQVHISAVELYGEELFDLLINAKRGSHSPLTSAHMSPFTTVDCPNGHLTPGLATPVRAMPTAGRLRPSATQFAPLRFERRASATRSPLPNGEQIGTRQGVAPTPCNSTFVPLRIREDAQWGVVVEGLTRIPMGSLEEAMHAVRTVVHQRHVGCTALNLNSSRSHVLLLISLEQWGSDTSQKDKRGQSSNLRTRSLLTLVDLAGSERVSATGAEGSRLKEAQRINLSLTLLGNVIRRLVTPRRGATVGSHPPVHIPYRDSKLTRLLQESIGGNAHTTLLCNLSSDFSDVQESLSTLRFAQIAKHVRNRPEVNCINTVFEMKKQLREARMRIAYLEQKLAEERKQSKPSRALSHSSIRAFKHRECMSEGGHKGRCSSEKDRCNVFSESKSFSFPAASSQSGIAPLVWQDTKNSTAQALSEDNEGTVRTARGENGFAAHTFAKPSHSKHTQTTMSTDDARRLEQYIESMMCDLGVASDDQQAVMRELHKEIERCKCLGEKNSQRLREWQWKEPDIRTSTAEAIPALFLPNISPPSIPAEPSRTNRYVQCEAKAQAGTASVSEMTASEKGSFSAMADDTQEVATQSGRITRGGWIASGAKTPRIRSTFRDALELLISAVRPSWGKESPGMHVSHTHLGTAQVVLVGVEGETQNESRCISEESHSTTPRTTRSTARPSIGDPRELVAMLMLYGASDIV